MALVLGWLFLRVAWPSDVLVFVLSLSQMNRKVKHENAGILGA